VVDEKARKSLEARRGLSDLRNLSGGESIIERRRVEDLRTLMLESGIR
jgi:hypothetical protein